jgi:sialate O-acetylesterase
MDVTYVNGEEVGHSLEISGWDKDRIYRVPAGLIHKGGAVVAIRMVNTVAEGGIFGRTDQLSLSPADRPGEKISLTGEWKYKIAYRFPDLPPMADPNTPSVLFNGMLSPLTDLAIRGAIWYQGEANVSRAMQYREIFPLMIRDWRSAWGQGEFPFYFVQLAPFKYGYEYAAAELREAQFMTLSEVQNTGMAVTMDIGDPDDIHPTNKRDVGRRLALWALAKDYGKELVYSGPLFAGQVVEGDEIRVMFEHTGSGLVIKDGPLRYIEIAGEDRQYRKATARIEGNSLVVSHPGVPEPVAVRYGWRNAAEPNLFNLEGLPASSFSSDTWPRVTE